MQGLLQEFFQSFRGRRQGRQPLNNGTLLGPDKCISFATISKHSLPGNYIDTVIIDHHWYEDKTNDGYTMLYLHAW